MNTEGSVRKLWQQFGSRWRWLSYGFRGGCRQRPEFLRLQRNCERARHPFACSYATQSCPLQTGTAILLWKPFIEKEPSWLPTTTVSWNWRGSGVLLVQFPTLSSLRLLSDHPLNISNEELARIPLNISLTESSLPTRAMRNHPLTELNLPPCYFHVTLPFKKRKKVV